MVTKKCKNGFRKLKGKCTRITQNKNLIKGFKVIIPPKIKNKNPFLNYRVYLLSLILPTIFVILLVANYVTNQITNNVLNDFENGCSIAFKDRPINLERCLQKVDEARTFESLNKEICGGCGENQLCLKEDDLKYCEQQFDSNSVLINLRNIIKSIVQPISGWSLSTNIFIIIGLFIIGFIIASALFIIK